MRAIQITNLNGPDEALELVDMPEPEPSHMLTPGSGVLVDVHAAGVSFPEVLQTRGEYQFKPEPPFVPGSEVGGVRRDTGERVAAFCFLGARVIGVVSSDEKEQVARDAGADEVVRADGFKDAVKGLGGADLVLDPVGGDRFTDSLRSLNEEGR